MSCASVRRGVVAILVGSFVLFVFHAMPGVASIAAAGVDGCVGDCDVSGDVVIDDLLVMVNIALGNALIEQCPAGSANGDPDITVDEILIAVGNALNGCPATPTPTEDGATPTPTQPGVVNTATPTPSTVPTATATFTVSPTQPPAEQARPLAARAALAVKGLSVAPVIVSAIANGINIGGAAASAVDEGGAAGTCPLGGTATRSGNFPVPPVSFQLNQCKVATRDGAVTFNGSGSITGNILRVTFGGDITAQFEDSTGNPTVTAHASLMGTVQGIPQTGGPCQLQSLTLVVSTGNLSATIPGVGTAQINFANTTVAINNITYDASCNPEIYRLTFNGNAALLRPDHQVESVTFNQLIMDVDESGAATLLELTGGMTSTCLGGQATLSTPQELSVPADALCPNAGHIHVTNPSGMGDVFYRSDMSVDVDTDGNGVTDITAPNCLDPRLLMCAA